MKNKLKIKVSKSPGGDIFTDYARVSRSLNFRYLLLRKIVADAAADMTIMVNTNQRIEGSVCLLDEDYLKAMNLQYIIVPVTTNPRPFFGVMIKRKSRNGQWAEKRILFDFTCDDFTEEWFNKIRNCDIAIGMGRKKTFEETCVYWKTEGEGILFDTQYFQNCLYDSVLCTRVRSTFNTERYVREIADEMGV